jgi:hypothetical protein
MRRYFCQEKDEAGIELGGIVVIEAPDLSAALVMAGDMKLHDECVEVRLWDATDL